MKAQLAENRSNMPTYSVAAQDKTLSDLFVAESHREKPQQPDFTSRQLLIDDTVFTEIFSRFIPAMKAKDMQLYRHSLRVHSLALSFTTTSLHLPEAEAVKIG